VSCLRRRCRDPVRERFQRRQGGQQRRRLLGFQQRQAGGQARGPVVPCRIEDRLAGLGDADHAGTVIGLVDAPLRPPAPDDLVHDLFAASLWPDHPLGRPIAGVQETVQALGRADLVAFMDAYCRPDTAIVAAAGRLEHEQIVELVQRWLGGWRGRHVPVEISPPAARTAVTLRNKEIEQVHLCLGGPGYPQAHEDRYALAVLDTALGGGMSSRLFQEIREERGLAYAVSTYHAAYRDVGAFVVYCGTSPAVAREVVRLVFDNLGRATKGLPAEEITRAKESLKGSLMLDLETPGSRMSKLARSEQYFGRQLTLDEIIADVDAVDADDVRRVATALFVPERMSLAAIGPFDAHSRLADELREEVRRYAGA